MPDEQLDDVQVSQMMMQNFITDTTNSNSYFDIISNKGFHRVRYERVPYEVYIEDKRD